MTNINSSYLPTSIYLPESDDQKRVKLIELLSQQAKSINRREIGTYDPIEGLTGQSWPPAPGDSPTRRQDVFRKIVEVEIDSAGAPNSNNFPHGLTPTGYLFTRISGAIGNGTNSWIPLPFPGTDETLVSVNATDVVIENTTSAFDGYTGYVVLEYIKR